MHGGVESVCVVGVLWVSVVWSVCCWRVFWLSVVWVVYVCCLCDSVCCVCVANVLYMWCMRSGCGIGAVVVRLWCGLGVVSDALLVLGAGG